MLVVTGPLGAQAASGYTLPVTPRLAEGARAGRDRHRHDRPLRRHRHATCGGWPRRRAAARRIELERLPLAAGATLEQAAAGGEDYELLAARAAAAPPLPGWVTEVGELTERRGGACCSTRPASRRELAGWDHFR